MKAKSDNSFSKGFQQMFVKPMTTKLHEQAFVFLLKPKTYICWSTKDTENLANNSKLLALSSFRQYLFSDGYIGTKESTEHAGYMQCL